MKKVMDSKIQDENQPKPNVKTYLITEKSDISKFSQQKITNDLDRIKKAEMRTKQRISITIDKKGNAASRAMNVLSLRNPFKGI